MWLTRYGTRWSHLEHLDDLRGVRQTESLPLLESVVSPGAQKLTMKGQLTTDHFEMEGICRYAFSVVHELPKGGDEWRISPRWIKVQAIFTLHEVGSDNGGRTAAVLFSMTASCKRHDIDPFAWLRDVLRRLPTQPGDRLNEFLPDVWFANHPKARRKRAA